VRRQDGMRSDQRACYDIGVGSAPLPGRRVITDFDEYTCHFLDSIFAYQYSNSLHGGKPVSPQPLLMTPAQDSSFGSSLLVPHSPTTSSQHIHRSLLCHCNGRLPVCLDKGLGLALASQNRIPTW